MSVTTIRIPWGEDAADAILVTYDPALSTRQVLRYACPTPNRGTEPRTKRIRLRTATGSGAAVLEITQRGEDAYIRATPSVVTFTAEGAPATTAR